MLQTDIIDKSFEVSEDTDSLQVQPLFENLASKEEIRDTLQEQISEGQRFLENAKAHQKSTGEYADALKWAEIKTLVRDKTNELHSMNREIKQINRKLNSQSNDSRFRQVAKEILDPAVFASIVQQTKE